MASIHLLDLTLARELLEAGARVDFKTPVMHSKQIHELECGPRQTVIVETSIPMEIRVIIMLES